MDIYSRYPIVEVMKNTSGQFVIQKFNKILPMLLILKNTK